MPFPEFLEQQGFQADACESCTHPDFYALAERLWIERNAFRESGRLALLKLAPTDYSEPDVDGARRILHAIMTNWPR